MAIDSIPIPSPLLDPRDGVELAAEAVARMNVACPELTNNDPASPFNVMAESQAFHVEQVLYAINRLPDAVQVVLRVVPAFPWVEESRTVVPAPSSNA